MTLIWALVVALIGCIPLIRRPAAAVIMFCVGWLASAGIIYLVCPTMAWPLFGGLGVLVLMLWTIAAMVDGMVQGGTSWAAWFPIGGLLLYIVFGMTSCDVWRNGEYRDLIGQVENRQWTQDVQPKDPGHVRLVTPELAFYLANKQLGEAPGSVGSQFEISKDLLTLQIVKGELWYVAPLDFKGYSVWTSTEGSPGYVMVHAEDPKRQVIIEAKLKMKYLASAYFGDELERHIWGKYGTKYVLRDYTFELDDNGKPFWTITATHPTVAWSGEKIDGVIVVDPVTGQDTFYKMGEVPSWIDRVMPRDLTHEYVSYYTKFVHGWLNSAWAGKDVAEAEVPEIAYGADGDPYLVTGLATSGKDDKSKKTSLTGLMYTDARTGKTVFYKANGGTSEAVIDLVNSRVGYRKLHGSMSQVYNIYGVMTAIVPLLGENHSYQGVAFVDVANMQMAESDTIESALRKYQQVLSTGGQQVAPEKRHNLSRLTGTVSRFTAEARDGVTSYYLYLSNYPHIFVGNAEVSPKLRITHEGDTVTLGFIDSREDVVPLITFDNAGIRLAMTAAQTNLQERVTARQSTVRDSKDANDARIALQGMTDKQILELMEGRNVSGKH